MRSAVLVALGVLGALGAPVGTVALAQSGRQLPSERPGFYVTFNAAWGAGRAAVAARAAGRPVFPAALRGAAGGLATYAGTVVVGRGGDARVAGVLLTAVGASVVRNAGAGAPVLSDIVIPLAPFYLRVRPGESRPVSVRMSAASTLTAARLFLRAGGRTHIDWRESLVSGGVTFRSPSGRIGSGGIPLDVQCPAMRDVYAEYLLGAQGIDCDGASATTSNGIISLGRATPATLPTVEAHETVHRAQFVRDASAAAPASHLLLTRPFRAMPLGDGRLGRTLRVVGRAVDRTIVLDYALPLHLGNTLTGMADGHRNDNLYEREADFLTGQRTCGVRSFAGCAW